MARTKKKVQDEQRQEIARYLAIQARAGRGRGRGQGRGRSRGAGRGGGHIASGYTIPHVTIRHDERPGIPHVTIRHTDPPEIPHITIRHPEPPEIPHVTVRHNEMPRISHTMTSHSPQYLVSDPSLASVSLNSPSDPEAVPSSSSDVNTPAGVVSDSTGNVVHEPTQHVVGPQRFHGNKVTARKSTTPRRKKLSVAAEGKTDRSCDSPSRDAGNIFDKILGNNACLPSSPVKTRRRSSEKDDHHSTGSIAHDVKVFTSVDEALLKLGESGKIPVVRMTNCADSLLKRINHFPKTESTQGNAESVENSPCMAKPPEHGQNKGREPGFVRSANLVSHISRKSLKSTAESAQALSVPSSPRSEKRKRSPNVRLGRDMILLPWHATRRSREKSTLYPPPRGEDSNTKLESPHACGPDVKPDVKSLLLSADVKSSEVSSSVTQKAGDTKLSDKEVTLCSEGGRNTNGDVQSFVKLEEQAKPENPPDQSLDPHSPSSVGIKVETTTFCAQQTEGVNVSQGVEPIPAETADTKRDPRLMSLIERMVDRVGSPEPSLWCDENIVSDEELLSPSSSRSPKSETSPHPCVKSPGIVSEESVSLEGNEPRSKIPEDLCSTDTLQLTVKLPGDTITARSPEDRTLSELAAGDGKGSQSTVGKEILERDSVSLDKDHVTLERDVSGSDSGRVVDSEAVELMVSGESPGKPPDPSGDAPLPPVDTPESPSNSSLDKGPPPDGELLCGPRTREPAPLSVLSTVENATLPPAMSAFMSDDLDSYLQSQNRKLCLASQQPQQPAVDSALNSLTTDNSPPLRTVKRKRNRENRREDSVSCEPGNQVPVVNPDFDDIDGMLFVSFDHQDSMKAHINIECQKHFDDNNYHFLDMCKLHEVANLKRKFGIAGKLPKMLRQKESNFRGIHMKWFKYLRLFRRELARVKGVPFSCKTAEATNLNKSMGIELNKELKVNLTRTKLIQKDSPEHSLPIPQPGKLHWRTEQRLLKSLAPADIKNMGLELKKKRRKNMIFTHRKGSNAKVEYKVGRFGRVQRSRFSQDNEYYYGNEYKYYSEDSPKRRQKTDLPSEVSPPTCSPALLPKKMSLKKKLMKKYNLCGLKKLRRIWRRKLETVTPAAEKKVESVGVFDQFPTLTETMALHAVTALDFDGLSVLPRSEEAIGDSVSMEEDGQLGCAKPGCRYGCVCHLFHSGPGARSSDSDEAGKDAAAAVCEKEYCRLGCICSSLDPQQTQKERHCGKSECMFGCLCDSGVPPLDADTSHGGSSDEIPQLQAVTEALKSPDSGDSRRRLEVPPPDPSPPRALTDAQKKVKGKDKFANLPQRVGSQRVAKNLDAITRKALMYMDPEDIFPKPKRRRRKKDDEPPLIGGIGRSLTPDEYSDLLMDRTLDVVSHGEFSTLGINVPSSCARTSAFNPARHSRRYSPAAGKSVEPTVEVVDVPDSPQRPKDLPNLTTRALSTSNQKSQKKVQFADPQTPATHSAAPAIPVISISDDDSQSETNGNQRSLTSDTHQSASKQRRKRKQKLGKTISDCRSSPSKTLANQFCVKAPAKYLVTDGWSTHMVCLRPTKRNLPESGAGAKLIDSTPHLLEIRSNCNWDADRTALLSRIARCLVPGEYPPCQTFQVKQLTAEILPKASKPAKIPADFVMNFPPLMFPVRVTISPTWFHNQSKSKSKQVEEVIIDDTAGEMTASKKLSLNLSKELKNPAVLPAKRDRVPPAKDGGAWASSAGISGLSSLSINKTTATNHSTSNVCDGGGSAFRLKEGQVVFKNSKLLDSIDLTCDEQPLPAEKSPEITRASANPFPIRPVQTDTVVRDTALSGQKLTDKPSLSVPTTTLNTVPVACIKNQKSGAALPPFPSSNYTTSLLQPNTSTTSSSSPHVSYAVPTMQLISSPSGLAKLVPVSPAVGGARPVVQLLPLPSAAGSQPVRGAAPTAICSTSDKISFPVLLKPIMAPLKPNTSTSAGVAPSTSRLVPVKVGIQNQPMFLAPIALQSGSLIRPKMVPNPASPAPTPQSNNLAVVKSDPTPQSDNLAVVKSDPTPQSDNLAMVKSDDQVVPESVTLDNYNPLSGRDNCETRDKSVTQDNSATMEVSVTCVKPADSEVITVSKESKTLPDNSDFLASDLRPSRVNSDNENSQGETTAYSSCCDVTNSGGEEKTETETIHLTDHQRLGTRTSETVNVESQELDMAGDSVVCEVGNVKTSDKPDLVDCGTNASACHGEPASDVVDMATDGTRIEQKSLHKTVSSLPEEACDQAALLRLDGSALDKAGCSGEQDCPSTIDGLPEKVACPTLATMLLDPEVGAELSEPALSRDDEKPATVKDAEGMCDEVVPQALQDLWPSDQESSLGSWSYSERSEGTPPVSQAAIHNDSSSDEDGVAQRPRVCESETAEVDVVGLSDGEVDSTLRFSLRRRMAMGAHSASSSVRPLSPSVLSTINSSLKKVVTTNAHVRSDINRVVHQSRERRRRWELCNTFRQLRHVIGTPEMSGDQIVSKVQILAEAEAVVATLKHVHVRLENELAHYRRRNRFLRKKLQTISGEMSCSDSTSAEEGEIVGLRPTGALVESLRLEDGSSLDITIADDDSDEQTNTMPRAASMDCSAGQAKSSNEKTNSRSSIVDCAPTKLSTSESSRVTSCSATSSLGTPTSTGVSSTPPDILQTSPGVRVTSSVLHPRDVPVTPPDIQTSPRVGITSRVLHQISSGVPVTSPVGHQISPGVRGISPVLQQISPGVRVTSPVLQQISPGVRTISPVLQQISPDVRVRSPDIQQISPGVSVTSSDIHNKSSGLCLTPPDVRQKSPGAPLPSAKVIHVINVLHSNETQGAAALPKPFIIRPVTSMPVKTGVVKDKSCPVTLANRDVSGPSGVEFKPQNSATNGGTVFSTADPSPAGLLGISERTNGELKAAGAPSSLSSPVQVSKPQFLTDMVCSSLPSIASPADSSSLDTPVTPVTADTTEVSPGISLGASNKASESCFEPSKPDVGLYGSVGGGHQANCWSEIVNSTGSSPNNPADSISTGDQNMLLASQSEELSAVNEASPVFGSDGQSVENIEPQLPPTTTQHGVLMAKHAAPIVRTGVLSPCDSLSRIITDRVSESLPDPEILFEGNGIVPDPEILFEGSGIVEIGLDGQVVVRSSMERMDSGLVTTTVPATTQATQFTDRAHTGADTDCLEVREEDLSEAAMDDADAACFVISDVCSLADVSAS